MDNHPIPQDITGFEFKLIGDMTIKQFGYVASGVVIAFVLFSSPLIAIVKIPLALAFAGIGAAFAFLPIEGRPMDLMLRNFFKAVFSPTQYIYRKTGGELFPQAPTNTAVSTVGVGKLPLISQKQLKDFLNSLPIKRNKLDQKETVFFQSVNQYAATAPKPSVPGFIPTHAFVKTQTQQPQQTPMAKTEKPTEQLIKQPPVESTRKAAEPAASPKEYLEAHQKTLELQGNLSDLLLQKQQLETRLIDMQKTLTNQGKSVFTPSVATPTAPMQTKFVRSIPQSMQRGVGLPIAPEFPNIITGIIKDPRGNPLANILVEVKDEQGNAVRAFKTNALGQFASATPLVNGNYTVDFEDPKEQNKFDTVAFKAGGEIILPLEVISVDTREELRRSLFN
jgi:hypothetical protein